MGGGTGQPAVVCCLQRALYGLRQSPHAWYDTITAYLSTVGFVQSIADPCLFILSSSAGVVYIAIYVDDFTIVGSSCQLVDEAKAGLAATFHMKDLGNINKLLGLRVQVDRVAGTISVSQAHYAEAILQRFGFHKSNLSTLQLPQAAPILCTPTNPLLPPSNHMIQLTPLPRR